MRAQFDSIIIGAGLGGLTAGALLSQKGEKVLVLEKHSIAGGCATNFRRKEFMFDSSLHSISEMKPGAPLFESLRNLGVWDKVKLIPHKSVYRTIYPDIDLTVKAQDLAAYRAQLSALFPDEAGAIKRFFDELEALHADVFTALTTGAFSERLAKYAPLSADQLLTQFFKAEKLRRILFAHAMYFLLPPEELSALVWATFAVSYIKYGGYSIEGGSQKLSDALVEAIQERGSEFRPRSEVTEILTEGEKVIGVRTPKEEFFAPKVIANTAPHAIVSMVGRDKLPREFVAQLGKMEVSLSCLQLYLGLDCELSELGVGPDEYENFYWGGDSYSSQFERLRNNDLSDEHGTFALTFYSNVDRSLAPAGKSVLTVFAPVGGEPWFYMSPDEYHDSKEKFGHQLLQKAERWLPGLSKHVKMAELGTPRTVHRYTNNTHGAIVGFALKPTQSFALRFPVIYPLKGLYQVGHWAFPAGGFSGAMLSAEHLVNAHLSRSA